MKSFSYIFERYSGIVIGWITAYVLYNNWFDGTAIVSEKYYDIIIKASSTLFGFLLAVLALILNGKSEVVKEMQKYDSFPRLIHYHKVIVFLSLIIMVSSVLLYTIIAPVDGVKYFIGRYGKLTLKVFVCLHSGISAWTVVDTAIFVNIFYKIILSTAKDEPK